MIGPPDCTVGPAPWCGTLGGYTNHACRGDACTQAQRTYNRRYQPGWRARRVAAGLTVRGAPRKAKRVPS
jgi:hypothetical protein